MKIDLTTLALFQAIIFGSEGALFLYQTKTQPSHPSAKYWMSGSFLLCAGMLSMIFVPYKHLKVFAVAANPFLIGGLLLVYAGIRRLYAFPSRRWTLLGVFAGWSLLYYWFLFVCDDLAARTLIIHLAIFGIALTSSLTMASSRLKIAHAAQKLASRIFFGYAVFSLIRSVLVLLIPCDNTYLAQGIGLVIAFMYPAFFSILWSFGLSGILTIKRAEALSGQTPIPLSSVNLSAREHEIASLLLQGLSYDVIADRSCISKNTVKTHAKNIYAKFEVSSRVELMRHVAPEAAEHPPPHKTLLVSRPEHDHSDEF